MRQSIMITYERTRTISTPAIGGGLSSLTEISILRLKLKNVVSAIENGRLVAGLQKLEEILAVDPSHGNAW